MHGFLCSPDDVPNLRAELVAYGAAPTEGGHGLLVAECDLSRPDFQLVFLRQLLPEVQSVAAGSIRLWAERIVDALRQSGAGNQPWRLHLFPHYQTVNSSHAGENRCRLIHAALLERLGRVGRTWRKNLRPPTEVPFFPTESLVQLVLVEPDRGWLSVALAPNPAQPRRRISAYPGGEIPIASDPAAPSRAFAKLVEAEVRMGRRISAGETCVDLGACPGSWTYVALSRGARVVAVDRSPVRSDLLHNPRLRFHSGDAFRFQPDSPVDWLLCDVIAAPERSVQLALDWVRARWCRHFVVTIKFKGHSEYGQLDLLKNGLRQLGADFDVIRLCANKNEACVFGRLSADANPARSDAT